MTDQQTSRTNITEALRRLHNRVANLPIHLGHGAVQQIAVIEAIEEEIRHLAAEPSEPTGFDLRSNDVRPPRSDATCSMQDGGTPCGRHLELGECSVHGRAAWPNPDACCVRNAFEDDAHSRTCPNFPRSDAVTAHAAYHREEPCDCEPQPDEPSTEAGHRVATDIGYHDEDCGAHGDDGCDCGLLDEVVAIEREARAASASVPPLDKLTPCEPSNPHPTCRYANGPHAGKFRPWHCYAAETPEQGRGDE